jgi:predicted dehydrogenase
MSRTVRRRDFLRSSTLAAGTAICWPLPAFSADPASTKKLNLAVIGVNRRGGANLKGVAGENIVALCDADETLLDKAVQQFPKAKRFVDFREMLDKIHRQIDAVVVSTPDHTHAVAAVQAIRLGKHCYCEKPLAHSVYEVRTVTNLARQYKVVTQIGTQIHAGDNYRRTVELVQSGAIGPVREVHVWSSASYGKGESRPQDRPPVPKGLHWDLWLGPAPERPYHPCYVPGKWRGWWDFGNGALGDFGCHYMDLAFWALKLRYPTSVECIDGPRPHPETTSPWLVVRYEYPTRGVLPPVTLTWYDGGRRPPLQKQKKLPDWKSGVLFVGQKGMIQADYTRNLLLPEKQFKDFQRPAPSIPKSLGHHAEWIQACKTGGPTTCAFDYSGPLSEAALLGAVAHRTQAKLVWNAAELKAVGCPRADQFLKREYRKGWTL